jgi:HEAT repeat protein
MEGTAPVTRGQRRLPPWMTWSGIAVGLLGVLALALWLLLPRWLPEVVIRWSPWVEPALRAVPWAKSYSDDFDARVDAWGGGCLPAFARALHSGSVDVRCAAVRGLCRLAGRPDLRPVVIPMLLAVLADRDRTVLLAALDGLGGLAADGDQPRISGLAQRLGPFLRDDDPKVRQEAVFALSPDFAASGEGATDMPLLIATLTDERPEVRAATAEVIAHVRDQRAAKIIIATLDAPDARLRRAAVVAAGATQMSEMVEPLGRLLATADPGTRAEILRAFESIGDYATVPFIIRASADPEREVRLLAVERLAVFAELVAGRELDGKRELAEAIAAALRDGDAEVAAAAQAAATHLDPRAPRKAPPAPLLPPPAR